MTQRILKFRIWNEEDKEMRNPRTLEDIYFKDNGDLFLEDFVFMQFTGLLDKNGIEIYEGDLLKDLHGDEREVVFHDGGFWCRYPNGDCYMPAKEYREVVGNVYQLITKEL